MPRRSGGGDEAAAAEARAEREIAAAEQHRLMTEVFELKLQLTQKEEDGRVLLEVSPGLLGHVVSTGARSKELHKAALLLEGTVSPTQAEQRSGLRESCMLSPWKSRLLQALQVDKPQGAAQTATTELCLFSGKMVRTKETDQICPIV